VDVINVIIFVVGLFSGVFIYKLGGNDARQMLGEPKIGIQKGIPRIILPNIDFFKKDLEKEEKVDPYVEGLTNILGYTGEEVEEIEPTR
jgi:hypothetical protein